MSRKKKQVVNGEVIETATLAHVGVSQLTRRKEWKVNSKSSNRNRLEQGAHSQDFQQVLMVASHRLPTYHFICSSSLCTCNGRLSDYRYGIGQFEREPAAGIRKKAANRFQKKPTAVLLNGYSSPQLLLEIQMHILTKLELRYQFGTIFVISFVK